MAQANNDHGLVESHPSRNPETHPGHPSVYTHPAGHDRVPVPLPPIAEAPRPRRVDPNPHKRHRNR